MALQIRKHTYRDRDGFLICGKDLKGRSLRIFTETRASAEVIRQKKRAGKEIVLEDFYIGKDATA